MAALTGLIAGLTGDLADLEQLFHESFYAADVVKVSGFTSRRSVRVFAGEVRVHVGERAARVALPGPHMQLVERPESLKCSLATRTLPASVWSRCCARTEVAHDIEETTVKILT